MAGYPIFFAFKDVVSVGQFKALINARGRALLTYEGGKWWLYGVQPGGMAANGSEPKETFKAFCTAFGNIMRDIASETDCPKEFEKIARQFFDDIDKADDQVWQASREKIRSGKLDVPQKLGAIKKISDDFDVAISIIVSNNPGIKKGDIVQEEDRYSTAA